MTQRDAKRREERKGAVNTVMMHGQSAAVSDSNKTEMRSYFKGYRW